MEINLNNDISENFLILEVYTNIHKSYYVYFKGIRVFYSNCKYDIENIIWDYAKHEIEDYRKE